MVANQKTARQELIDEILISLGNNLIDVDLTLDDLNTAVKYSLQKYRQRSSNAVEEAAFFISLRPDMQVLTLPEEIVEVTNIYRRGISANAGYTTGNQHDPFSLAYTNLYLLQPTGQGDLLTYEYYTQWTETAGKLFGATYDFRWSSRDHKLTIIRAQRVYEDVLLKTYMHIPDEGLITGIYSGPWIRDWAIAEAKLILAEAYKKFSSIPGPTGSITLDGAGMKAEALAAMADLEIQIQNYRDGGKGLGWTIG